MTINVSEAVVWRYSLESMFLEISQNSQENTCARASYLIKLKPATLLRKRLWHRCFPVNFAKFLRILFLTQHLWWLLVGGITSGTKNGSNLHIAYLIKNIIETISK